MSFLSPWSFLWLLLIGPLVALYILRRRRQERVIASTLLWQEALADLRAERPWRRLVPQVSLLLQILAIIAGSLALARPSGSASIPSGAQLAIIVDASSSMAAFANGEETRFELARNAAQAYADDLPPGGRMMLIESGRETAVLSPLTSDRHALSTAVDRLQIRGTSANLEEAVAIASERLADSPEGSRIVILTDGSQQGEVELLAALPIEVQEVTIASGYQDQNLGIVDADVRPRPEEGADRADIFARVLNPSSEPRDVFVIAELMPGQQALASRRLRIDSEQSSGVVLQVDLPPDDQGRAAHVGLRLEPADGLPDVFALDDQVVLPSPGARRLPVFVIGTPPQSVMRALRTDSEVELFRTSLPALAEREEQTPLDGLQIFCGDVPAEAPGGDSIVFAPNQNQVFEARLADGERGNITDWSEADPRLRFANLGRVRFGEARDISGMTPLVQSSAGVIAAGIERPAGETTLFSFNPDQSNWPSDPSFVIVMRNLLERARNRRASGGIPDGPLGESLRVPASDQRSVEVETPSGATIEAPVQGGLAIVPIQAEPGVYRAEVGERELFAMRNHLSESESDISHRAVFVTGEGQTLAGVEAPEERSDLWQWVGLLLLLILALEIAWATRSVSGRPSERRRRAA